MKLGSRYLLMGLTLAVVPCMAQRDASDLYETTVKPILKTNCIACHSPANQTSGLSVATRESILQGGNRGPAIDGKNPGTSLLLSAIRHTGDLKMPPTAKLKDDQIAAIEEWLKSGAPMATSVIPVKKPGADHWAFQAPKKATPPRKTANPIDAFVLDRLAAAKLKPSPQADRATVLRRVSLDLTGLPPTSTELADFITDNRPDAYERVVDRLLASPHYGERWGRVWLDMARYADTDGYTIDAPREMWMYRDWVIDALNRDMPFDRFVTEQLAGDLLPHASNQQLIATGFHRNTPTNFEGGIDHEQYRVEAVADRIATNGAVFLGLTLGCARCHDHKYDPISQREFYQMFSIFNNYDEVAKEEDRKVFNKPFLELGTPEQVAALAEWQEKFEKLDGDFRKFLENNGAEAMSRPEAVEMKKALDAHRKTKPKYNRAMIVRELSAPREAYIHLNGDFTRRGVTVGPGTPAVLPPLKPSGERITRLDFAQWLTRRDHPLTARVTVNRIWQKYFGRGIVETESDFGLQGAKPSHPELLDWLAVEFMDRGWSQKQIHKLIVTSDTYKQSSAHRPDAAAVDPGNALLARQTRLPLDAELIRDSALVASGLLEAKIGGPSVYPPLPAGANSVTQVLRPWEVSAGGDRYRRGLYTFMQRSAPHPALALFDAPDASSSCTRRVRSNTPLQALMLLNDETAVEFSDVLGRRLKATGADIDRIEQSYMSALNRKSTPDERDRVLRFVSVWRDSRIAEEKIWAAVARALFNTDEFLTRP
jgi:mono/diheme cytochrome c family protein